MCRFNCQSCCSSLTWEILQWRSQLGKQGSQSRRTKSDRKQNTSTKVVQTLSFLSYSAIPLLCWFVQNIKFVTMHKVVEFVQSLVWQGCWFSSWVKTPAPHSGQNISLPLVCTWNCSFALWQIKVKTLNCCCGSFYHISKRTRRHNIFLPMRRTTDEILALFTQKPILITKSCIMRCWLLFLDKLRTFLRQQCARQRSVKAPEERLINVPSSTMLKKMCWCNLWFFNWKKIPLRQIKTKLHWYESTKIIPTNNTKSMKLRIDQTVWKVFTKPKSISKDSVDMFDFALLVLRTDQWYFLVLFCCFSSSNHSVQNVSLENVFHTNKQNTIKARCGFHIWKHFCTQQ